MVNRQVQLYALQASNISSKWMKKPEDYSQEDDAGLDLIDFYVLPHYLTAPFKKVTEKIMTDFSDLNLCPINNRQGIVIDGEDSKGICKD